MEWRFLQKILADILGLMYDQASSKQALSSILKIAAAWHASSRLMPCFSNQVLILYLGKGKNG